MKAMIGTACVFLGLFQSALVLAQGAYVQRMEFECDGSQVVIDSSPKGFRSPEEAFVRTGQIVQAQIVVVRGEARATFQSWESIDYIGGGCFSDAQGKPHIVYRVACGGSGCHDSNWGIIDPRALLEILKPDGENTERAARILGMQPPPVPRWVSLLVPL